MTTDRRGRNKRLGDKKSGDNVVKRQTFEKDATGVISFPMNGSQGENPQMESKSNRLRKERSENARKTNTGHRVMNKMRSQVTPGGWTTKKGC